MPEFRQVRKKPEIVVERLDGGLNTKDGPANVTYTETPDTLNTDFGDRGSVETRAGTAYYQATGFVSNLAYDGGTNFNGTMVAFKGGTMYRMSGTMEVKVSASSGQFTSGRTVTYEQFQNVLFCSDGVNGPFRYTGGQGFYNMGIAEPSAATAVSGGAGSITTGTYYYKVAYVNTALVEGGVGSASMGTTLTATAAINVSNIPIGTGLEGVARRKIYRSNSGVSGTYKLVQTLENNTATAFTDTVAVGLEGANALTDRAAPKPFNAIKLWKERLWMPDIDNEQVIRYTDYDNPYVSQDASFFLVSKGSKEGDIKALGVQNDLLTMFKDRDAIHVAVMTDPTDDTSVSIVKSPVNYGIVGPKALTEEANGIIFAAKRGTEFVGFMYISGLDLVETQNEFLISQTLSTKIEDTILAVPRAPLSKMAIQNFKNRLYISVPLNSNSTRCDGLFLFDTTRIVRDADTAPGSWTKWAGTVGANDFAIYNNMLYGFSSDTDGRMIEYGQNNFTDADGSGIESYWLSKEIGGDGDIASWVKDFRKLIFWREMLGSYNMRVCIFIDGGGFTGGGTCTNVDLTSPSTKWDASDAIWDVSEWGPGSERLEFTLPLGKARGKRIQIGFYNTGNPGEGFKVHDFRIRFNYRGQR